MDVSVRTYVTRSNLRGFLALFRNWATIITAISLSIWLDHIVAYLIAVWVIGACQYSLGEVLNHEACHYNLFKNKKVNDLLDVFYALPFLQTVEEYRRQHLLHHTHLGERGKDHVVDDYYEFGLIDQKKKNSFWLWFGRPVFGVAGFLYLKMLFVSSEREESGFEVKNIKLISFWVILAATVVYFQVLDLFILYWIVPLFWSATAFLYWTELSEHFATSSGTRSHLSNVYNLIWHNQGYHALHHTYATIPWYMLPRAYKELKASGVNFSEDISMGFFNTYRQIKENYITS